jgi:hypothetical protein
MARVCEKKKLLFCTKGGKVLRGGKKLKCTKGKLVMFTGRLAGKDACHSVGAGGSASLAAKANRNRLANAARACIRDGVRPKGKVKKGTKSPFNRCVADKLSSKNDMSLRRLKKSQYKR